MQVNGVSANQASGQNFGHVIKTRFFVVQPDRTKVQIQHQDTIKFLAKRLCFHLTQPEKAKKGRIDRVSRELGEFDKHYKAFPVLRRIMNFNRSYDNCFYLLTGWDAETINCFAHTLEKQNKKANIINKHWEAVRDNSRRIIDMDGDELSLNIYFDYRRNSKTGENAFFLNSLNVVKEKFMQFPYRGRNENLP